MVMARSEIESTPIHLAILLAYCPEPERACLSALHGVSLTNILLSELYTEKFFDLRK